MGSAHDAHGLLHLRHGPVGGRRHVGRGAREPAQRVLAIAGVVGHAGHHLRVGRLDEQGADAADEAGDVAHDLPGDGLRAEEAGVAGIVHGVGHGVVRVREEPHGPTDDGAPEALERVVRHARRRSRAGMSARQPSPHGAPAAGVGRRSVPA